MDRRKLKSKKAIKSAFLSLLHEKELNKITVSEVTRLADIGRGTFYLHYQDIFALYEELETDIVDQMYQWIEKLYEDDQPISIEIFIQKITEYIVQNQDIIKLFIKEGENINLISKIKGFFEKKELDLLRQFTPHLNPAFELYKLEFIITGVMGVLYRWLKTGMYQTPEQISNIVSELVSS